MTTDDHLKNKKLTTFLKKVIRRRKKDFPDFINFIESSTRYSFDPEFSYELIEDHSYYFVGYVVSYLQKVYEKSLGFSKDISLFYDVEKKWIVLLGPKGQYWNDLTMKNLMANGVAKAIKESKSENILMFLKVSGKTYTRGNIVLYNKRRKELQRLDPLNDGRSSETLDYYVKRIFTRLFDNDRENSSFKFIQSNQLRPADINIAKKQTDKKWKLNNTNGFCIMWNLWLLEMRLKNPRLHIDTIIKKALHGKNPDEVIRGYTRHVILTIKDKFFKDKPNLNPVTISIQTLLNRPCPDCQKKNNKQLSSTVELPSYSDDVIKNESKQSDTNSEQSSDTNSDSGQSSDTNSDSDSE